ncbi:outer membrane protein assembly factor BamB [Mitsuaria sp. WAJ17]|uniref:outer membrane protein assembly factor BamB n=1 Tax=Mitsuaria sp. WAJ17 TaxID=2761452 RepID=UPI0015FF2AFE|nr:outer membrane protein assembly factor BamB [Mitsuaria sp. WAJ17]MBB2483919.1 outer membrane protein assembly factor BamB [Mitsuaria sp. WAJ17]
MKSLQLLRRGLLLATLPALLSACSLFSNSKDAKPAPLEAVTPAIAGKVVWQQRMDSVRFGLNVVALPDSFVVADSDGTVQRLKAADGSAVWRANLKEKLAAGVGSDGRYAAVVTRDNELLSLDEGKTLWRKPLSVPILTAPLVAGERIFVLTVDRAVLAFDAIDGRKLFELRRPGDPLTLLQPGGIASYKDTLVVGQGSRLAGVDPLRGTVRWEASVANPRGTNEVERLADVVGPLVRTGELLCARGFQSAVSCINAERGSTAWTRNVGGVMGVGGDAQAVVAGDASDRLTAWRTSNGDVLWNAEQFLNRKLSAPLVLGQSVVVGDFEGQVHFLNRETGKTQLRLPTDGSAIVAAPVAAGNTILVVTRNGGLFALRPQ